MDKDMLVLEDAAAAVLSVDKKYRRADFNGKIRLKKERDSVFNAYAKARLKLLEEGVISRDKDVEEMKEIRKEIARAKKIQSILVGTAKLAKLLGRLVI